MNGGKRYPNQKNTPSRHGGKVKEALPSSFSTDTENFINNLPLIRQSENAKILPKYSLILVRSEDDGVNMDDLDQLQFDLEKLLSTCALRNRFLHSEIESIDRVEDKHKKGKSYDKSSLKRKRPDDKSKYRDPKSGAKPIKRHYALPVNSLIGDMSRNEMSNLNMPKNETSDKFWASVEPYCAPVTASHLAFLDKLIEECSQEIDIKIPDLGEYYANEWTDSATNNEQELGLNVKPNADLKKNGLSAMVDTFSNPITQRLLAALIEEKVMTSFPGVTGKLKPSDLNMIKPAGSTRAALCMDQRLKKDLVEQGILTVDDLAKSQPEDEILQEIKKCQQELAAVNEFNVEELRRLKNVVTADLKKQDVKLALDRTDAQILELYNKIIMAKQKHVHQMKDEDLDKDVITKLLQEFENQGHALLEQQTDLQKNLVDLSEG